MASSNGKPMAILGAVASVIGGIIGYKGYHDYSEANGLIKALNDGDALLGTDSSASTSIWSTQASNARIMLIVGVVILVIGIIVLIAGIVSGMTTKQIAPEYRPVQTSVQPKANISDRLSQLEDLKNKGIITDAEYDEKRKEIINDL